MVVDCQSEIRQQQKRLPTLQTLDKEPTKQILERKAQTTSFGSDDPHIRGRAHLIVHTSVFGLFDGIPNSSHLLWNLYAFDKNKQRAEILFFII